MKPKRALILHANNDYNSGDLLTYWGTKYLLTKALQGAQNLDIVQFDMIRAHDTEPKTYIKEYAWGDIDIIVLAGSPWIWNTCDKSKKYKLLTDALKRWPKAKVIGLGIGSCFSNEVYRNMRQDEVDRYFFNDPTRKQRLHDIYKRFNYILVRDNFAKYILERCNVKSTYSYDTSIFAHHRFGKSKYKGQRKKRALFFYKPDDGISKNCLNFKASEYIQFQLDWAKKYNADIYCNGVGEKIFLEDKGIKASFSVDLDFLSSKFTEYNDLLSGRVHMAILGFMTGIPNITLLPIDTRFMTVLKFGITLKFVGHSFNYSPIKVAPAIWKDINKEEVKIIKGIRNAIA